MLNHQTIKELAQNEPAWFVERRLHYLKDFATLDLPLWKYGIGIVVDIRDLDLTNVNPLVPQEETIVADEQVEVLPFKEALQKYGEEMKDSLVEEEPDKMNALHHAFTNSGSFIRIPEGVTCNQPIIITTDNTNKTSIENIIIIAEKNSKALIVEVSKGDNKSFALKSQRVYTILKEGAQLTYKTLQNLDYNTHHFSKRQATVAKNASMEWIDCSLGAKLSQTTTSTNLTQENANGKNWSVVFGDKTQCFDLLNQTAHQARQTTSNMLTKVVLNEQARSVYRGLVKIHPKAAACEGYQKEDTLLLSEEARADAVPNLEISNDDVQCSHAATVSQIDEDKLFYMTSRGLTPREAKKAMVEGFFAPLMKGIGQETLLKEMQEAITERLEGIQ